MVFSYFFHLAWNTEHFERNATHLRHTFRCRHSDILPHALILAFLFLRVTKYILPRLKINKGLSHWIVYSLFTTIPRGNTVNFIFQRKGMFSKVKQLGVGGRRTCMCPEYSPQESLRLFPQVDLRNSYCYFEITPRRVEKQVTQGRIKIIVSSGYSCILGHQQDPGQMLVAAKYLEPRED